MKKIRIIAIALLLVVAVNALFAGYSFMTAPGGGSMKASISLLRFSCFPDFFIPGLILFSVNGICCLFTAMALIRKWRNATLLLIVQGLLLTGWIVIQVFILREFNILHAVFGSIGISFCLSGIYLHEKTI